MYDLYGELVPEFPVLMVSENFQGFTGNIEIQFRLIRLDWSRLSSMTEPVNLGM